MNAALGKVFTPAPGSTGLAYNGATPANELLKFNVFLPDPLAFPPTPEGYATAVALENRDFRYTARREYLAPQYSYQFGKRYEPPAGFIMQGLGHIASSNDVLFAAMSAAGGPLPSVICTNMNVGTIHGTSLPAISGIMATLNSIDARGAMPNIGISVKDFSGGGDEPLDVEYVTDDSQAVPGAPAVSYAALVDLYATAIAQFGKPVFIRIGWEFNNNVGYTPYYFVAMYKKIRARFIELGVTNAAWVWCWEPSGTADYFDVDATLGPKWYPGDDQVDWYGIDMFTASSYFTVGGFNYAKAVAFLDAAATRGFPVMVPETDPAHTFEPLGITATGDPNTYWNGWFAKALTFYKAHGIKMICYVSLETKIKDPTTGNLVNQQIATNPGLLALWIAELSTEQYLDAGEQFCLNGYDGPQPDDLERDLYYLVDNGFAAAVGSTMIARGGDTGVDADEATTYLGPGDKHYGPAVDGNGAVIPYTGVAPPNYSGSGDPHADPDRPTALRCLVLLGEFLRLHGIEHSIDNTRLFPFGSTPAESLVGGYVAFGADRSAEMDLDAADSTALFAAFVLNQCPTFLPLLDQSGVNLPFIAMGMPAEAGSPSLYDNPTAALGDVVATHQAALSILTFGGDVGVASKNAELKVYMAYSAADLVGPPYTAAHPQGVAQNAGTSTFGAMAKTAFPNVRYVALSLAASTDVEDAILLTTAAYLADLVAWLNAVLVPTQTSATGSPLQGSAKQSYLLVSIEVNGETFRYTNWSTTITRDGQAFAPTPKLEVKLGGNTGALQDKSSTVLMPVDSVSGLFISGDPVAPATLTIIERVVSGPDVQELTHHVGRIVLGTRNPSGRAGFAELESSTIKLRASRSLGLLQSDQCVNTFAEPTGCFVDKAAITESATITAVEGNAVTLAGLADHDTENEGEYWRRGYIEVDGARVGIRAWSPDDPTVFQMIRPLPASWVGKVIAVVPGCDKKPTTCDKRWRNLDGTAGRGGFLGIGVAILPYNPNIEEGQ